MHKSHMFLMQNCKRKSSILFYKYKVPKINVHVTNIIDIPKNANFPNYTTTTKTTTTATMSKHNHKHQNKNIEKYHFDQRYPFTDSQLTFLLQLHHYLRHPSSKDSSSISTTIAVAALDCYEDSYHEYSYWSANSGASTSTSVSNGNHIQNVNTGNGFDTRDNHKVYPFANALKWIDTHLLLPYYSKSFFYDLVQCAIQHSHVFLNNHNHKHKHRNHNHHPQPNTDKSNRDSDSSDDDDDDDDDIEDEVTMNLFLEAMSGLTGRKGGPSFEIKVLYEFILKRCMTKYESSTHVNHNNDDKSGIHGSRCINTADNGEYKEEKESHLQKNHDLSLMNGGNIDTFTATATTANDDDEAGYGGMLKSTGTFGMETTVDIEDMIGLLYRLALSCHVLQHWSVFDEEQMKTKIDCDGISGKDEHGSKIRSKGIDSGSATTSKLDLDHIKSLGTIPPKNMIDSLASYQDVSAASSYDFSSSFLGGVGSGMGIGAGINSEMNTEVNYETFRNWVEINFPQMANIVSTFIHLSLFFNVKDSNARSHDKKKIDKEEKDDDESDSSSNDDDVRMMNLLIYAQGKRKMFQFPQLQQLVMANSFTQSTITRKIIATPPTSSILFETITTTQSKPSDNHNNKGVEGHFAFGMACMDSNLCGKWYRLYSTETDGFAFLNMQRALTGYTGPTVMIVRPTKANVLVGDNNALSSPGLFGFYTANPWMESNKFYGTSDCFLFRADPIWNVYRPRCFVQGWKIDHTIDDSLSSPLRKKKMKENYMYFHPSASHMNNGTGMMGGGGNGYRSMKSVKTSGILAGGTVEQPRFFISETFEQCVASSGSMIDMTFESGPLLPGQWDKYYNIDVLEVWGVGGEDIVRSATSAKERHEDMAEATRKKVQRVDRKQFLDDFRSGMFVGNKLFEHRFDGNIRHDFGADTSNQDQCE